MPNGRGAFARGLSRRGVVVGTIAALILAGGGATAWAFSSGGTIAFVTAAVTTGQATQTLQETGTIQPATEAAVGFQVGGQVSTVLVAVGQHVAAGQVLAKLDTTSLGASLAGGQAAVSADQAKLDNDEASQTAVLSASPVPSSTAPGPSSGSNSQLAGQVSAAQKKVASAQHQSDLDTRAAQQDLSQAAGACGASGGTGHSPAGGSTGSTTTTGPGSSPPTSGHRPAGTGTSPPTAATASVSTTSATSTATTSTTSTTSSTTSTTSSTTSTTSTSTTTLPPTTTPSPSTSTACSSALQSALGAEQRVAVDQQAVSSAEQGLAADLTRGGSGGGGSGGSGGAGGSVSSGGASLSGTGASGGGGRPAGSAAAVASPQQIAADQASLDAATEQLTIEQQALNDAQLTSPIPGTVAAVAISAGQTVSAGSSSAVITIVNPSAFDVVANVAVTDLSQLKAGDTAQVTPAGTSAPLPGKVTSVGVMGASSGSTATLPVTISLPSGISGLFSGATASVVIVVGQVSDSTVVPSSAVHTIGTRHIVDVLSGTKEQPTLVSVGAVGPLSTQITKGLHLGQRVVLADPSQPLPSSTGLTGPGLARLAGLGGGGRFVRVGGGAAGGARPGG